MLLLLPQLRFGETQLPALPAEARQRGSQQQEKNRQGNDPVSMLRITSYNVCYTKLLRPSFPNQAQKRHA